MTIQPNYAKFYAGLISTALFVVALATVINRITEGHWPDPLEALKWSLVILFLPPFLLMGDNFSYWSRAKVKVQDGGAWFWHIDYDPETGQCSSFLANGVA